jgi:hypothetical protein
VVLTRALGVKKKKKEEENKVTAVSVSCLILCEHLVVHLFHPLKSMQQTQEEKKN